MFLRPSENDLRYLKLYEKTDKKRKESWQKMHPDELMKANVRYLKFLIVQNLSEKTKGRIVVSPLRDS